MSKSGSGKNSDTKTSISPNVPIRRKRAPVKNYFLTQNDDVDEPTIPNIVRFTTFSSNRVKRLTAQSFNLDDKMMIGLKNEDCVLILFHVENKESHELMKLWYIVAEQTAGPIFASCNVLLEDKVGKAFARVKMNGSHPLNPYALHQWPVIMVYRKGYPVAVYNGESDVQSIIDWSLLLACRANYFEPIQIYAGMQAEYRHNMPTPLPYPDPKTNPEAKVSGQFYGARSKRGFYPSEKVVKSGTRQEQKEAILVKELQAEREGRTPTAQELTSGLRKNSELESERELIRDIQENNSDSESIDSIVSENSSTESESEPIEPNRSDAETSQEFSDDEQRNVPNEPSSEE